MAVECQKGFILLDMIIALGCGVSILGGLIFFHVHYMRLMERVVWRIEAVEYAQRILGYARNSEPVAFDIVPPPWHFSLTEISDKSEVEITWIIVKVIRDTFSYSLISVRV